MTSNMDYRLLLMKNADTIISNNQNIAFGNCSNIITVSENKPLVQNPYLIQGVTDNYLPFENSDLKSDAAHLKILLSHAKDSLIKGDELYAKKLISKDAFEGRNKRYAQLEASYKEMEQRLEKSMIRTPVKGVIQSNLIRANLVISLNKPAFVLMRLDSVDIRCRIPKSSIREHIVGEVVKVKEETREGGVFSGKIIAFKMSEKTASGEKEIVIRIKRF